MSIYKLFAQVDISDVNIPKGTYSGTNIQDVLSIVFGIAGGVALIFVIIGGIKFMTSQGDPGALSKARNTIIYALIGLAVCIAAFSIVNFVSGKL